MSKPYKYAGWPKGTRVKMVGDVLPELLNKEAVVDVPKYYDEMLDVYAYKVYHNGTRWTIYERNLKFVSYSSALTNRCRNDVTLLTAFNEDIFGELCAEKQYNHFPNYGDKNEI